MLFVWLLIVLMVVMVLLWCRMERVMERGTWWVVREMRDLLEEGGGFALLSLLSLA